MDCILAATLKEDVDSEHTVAPIKTSLGCLCGTVGINRAVTESGYVGVLSSYEQSLEQLTDGPGKSGPVEYAWISDTFLLYAPDDSKASFCLIEQRARLFVNALTVR